MGKWDLEVGIFALDIKNCDANARFKSNCLPYVYGYDYFFTRYPLEKTKFWNLIYLFTPASWMWTFISIFTTVIVSYLARIISVKMGLSGDSTEEIILFPFRFLKFPS